MNIKLIAPEMKGNASISSAETYKVQRVNLPLLASLTPPGHVVKLVDESFAPDNPDEDVDLVGITVMTDLAPWAYRIAAHYRARGVKVVMGGIHPTVIPQEALRHADAVAVGEGETIWPRIVHDAAAGKLERIYRAPGFSDLDGLPIPKRELYPEPLGRSYTPIGVGIETARGCPYNCEFCSTTQVLGKKFRIRPVREVVREMEIIPSRNLFIVDDSFGLNREAVGKLFSEMVPLKKHWIGQGTLSLAEDVGLLRQMKKSGCRGLLVGLESVDKKGRDQMGKLRSMKVSCGEAIRRFHGEGIALAGAFVFGFDHEDKTIFDRTTEFVLKHRIECAQLRTLCPFPGTSLYARLIEEGRLFDREWWLKEYPQETLLYRLKGMTQDEFREGFSRMIRDIYSVGSIVRRFFGISPLKRPVVFWMLYAGVNLGTRMRYLKDLELPYLDLSLGKQEAAEAPHIRKRRGRRLLPPELPM